MKFQNGIWNTKWRKAESKWAKQKEKWLMMKVAVVVVVGVITGGREGDWASECEGKRDSWVIERLKLRREEAGQEVTRRQLKHVVHETVNDKVWCRWIMPNRQVSGWLDGDYGL
jgi:hypothetical protein